MQTDNSKVSVINIAKRLLVFCAGQFILACGVVLAIKASLGASPTTVIPNVLYNILLDRGITRIGLGTCTTAIYCVYILVQFLILRKDFKLRMLLEIVVSFIFGYFVTMGQNILAFVPAPENYFIRIVYLVISIPIMSLGIAVYVIPQISPAPAEGVTAAMSQKTGWPIPKCLLIFDVVIVGIGSLISILYFHSLVGIREGTIICAFTLGPAMRPMASLVTEPLLKFCGLQTRRQAAIEEISVGAYHEGKTIITVDWEFGSGGDLLARDLAAAIGAKVYSNDELVGMEITESGLPERFVTEHEKLMRHSAMYDYATYAYKIQQTLDPLEQLYAAQVSVIRKLAASEDCAVIFGHCGNYILRDDPNCSRLFIHAATDIRVERAKERHNVDSAGARLAIGATDHSRAKYHHDFTGEMWGQARYYDLTISTTAFSKENSLALVEDAIERWRASRKDSKTA